MKIWSVFARSRLGTDSPPFYAQVNVYELVNKHARSTLLPLQFERRKKFLRVNFHLSGSGS